MGVLFIASYLTALAAYGRLKSPKSSEDEVGQHKEIFLPGYLPASASANTVMITRIHKLTLLRHGLPGFRLHGCKRINRLPLIIRHSVNHFPGLLIIHFYLLLYRRYCIPLGKTISAKIHKYHQINILNLVCYCK